MSFETFAGGPAAGADRSRASPNRAATRWRGVANVVRAGGAFAGRKSPTGKQIAHLSSDDESDEGPSLMDLARDKLLMEADQIPIQSFAQPGRGQRPRSDAFTTPVVPPVRSDTGDSEDPMDRSTQSLAQPPRHADPVGSGISSEELHASATQITVQSETFLAHIQGGSIGAEFVGNVLTDVAEGGMAAKAGLTPFARIISIRSQMAGRRETPGFENICAALSAAGRDEAVLTVVPVSEASRPAFWAQSVTVPVHEQRGTSQTVFFAVDVLPAAGGSAWRVWRRFNMWVALRDRLGAQCPRGFPPRQFAKNNNPAALVGKLTHKRDGMAEPQLLERQQALEMWIGLVLAAAEKAELSRTSIEALNQFLDPEDEGGKVSARNAVKGFVSRGLDRRGVGKILGRKKKDKNDDDARDGTGSSAEGESKKKGDKHRTASKSPTRQLSKSPESNPPKTAEIKESKESKEVPVRQGSVKNHVAMFEQLGKANDKGAGGGGKSQPPASGPTSPGKAVSIGGSANVSAYNASSTTSLAEDRTSAYARYADVEDDDIAARRRKMDADLEAEYERRYGK